MNKRNIILIGMPGAGKSSVGVILAKVLGYEFIDTDLVIQHREKRLLREIIADEGNEGFLRLRMKSMRHWKPTKASSRRAAVPFTEKRRWSILKKLESSFT
mgnify:CR=1 FL=1